MANTPFNTQLGKSNQPGRPVSIKSLTVLRAPDTPAGFEWSKPSMKPEALETAKSQYISQHEMPANLRPRYAGAVNQIRRRNISAGWRNPRGAA